MSPRHFPSFRHALAVLATGFALFVANQNASAALKIWDGDDAANNNATWTDRINWDNDVAPVDGDSLVFAGTVGLAPIYDFPDSTTFAGIAFAANAGSFTLNGSSDRIILAGDIVNSSSVLQTFGSALPLVLQQGINVNTTGDVTIASIISSPGGFGLTKLGPGTLTLTNAASTYTGGVTVNAGTLKIGVTYNSTTLNGPAGTATAPIILNGGNLDIGPFTIANPIMVNSNATIIDTSTTAGAFRSNVTGSAVLTFAISAGGTLTFGNGAATTLSAFQNFTGTISLGTSAGVLRFNAASNGVATGGSQAAAFDMGTGTGTLTIRNGGILQLGSVVGGTGTKLSGPTGANGSTEFQIGFLNTNTVFNGTIITGNSAVRPAALTKVGTGSLTLTNSASNYTGTTTVNGGTLIAQGDTTLGNSANIVINSGGQLTLTGGTTNNYIADFANVTIASGTPNGMVNLNFTGSDTVNSLNVNGAQLNPGTYTASTSETLGYLFGTGSLIVTSAVPEPSTWVMVLGGLGLLTMAARRSRRQKSAA